MHLTSRGLLLLLLPAPFLAAAAWFSPLLWLAVVVFAGGAVLLIVDWAAARPITFFRAQRHHGSRLSLGADNPIELTVQHRLSRVVQFQIRDEPPWQFETSTMVLSGAIGAGSVWSGRYSVRPLKRGDYQFGDINLRWHGPLDFIVRQGRIEAADAVKVYPDLLGVKRYDLLLRRNQVQEFGLRNARLTGQGTEFERLREYRPDDEYRRINWKATARRLRPITVAYQTERSQYIVAVLDTGRMMQSPVGSMAKLDYAINATLLLAYVAAAVGDKVGLLTFASEVQHYVAPKQGRAQFFRLLDQLYAVEPQAVEPDYGRGLSYLAHKQRRRALIILFTDVTGGASMEMLVQHVRLLARRSVPLVVTISDPDLRDMAQHAPHDSRQMYERAAAGQILRERRFTLESLRRQGVETLDTPANQLSLNVVSRYLDLKRQGRI